MSDQQISETRKKNNRILGLILGAFVILVFFITMAKMRNGASMEAFDHTIRPSLEQSDDAQ